MDIHAKKGAKVIFTGKHGYDDDKKHANEFLKVNEIYTINHTKVGGWHTDVYLEEFPDEWFNSVHFEDVD